MMDARVNCREARFALMPGHDGWWSFRDAKHQTRISRFRVHVFDAPRNDGTAAAIYTLPFSAPSISSSTFGSSMVAGIVH